MPDLKSAKTLLDGAALRYGTVRNSDAIDMPETLHRHDISDRHRALLESRLSGRVGVWGGVAQDNCRFNLSMPCSGSFAPACAMEEPARLLPARMVGTRSSAWSAGQIT